MAGVLCPEPGKGVTMPYPYEHLAIPGFRNVCGLDEAGEGR